MYGYFFQDKQFYFYVPNCITTMILYLRRTHVRSVRY